MPYKREVLPEKWSTGDRLYEDLIGIGFLLSGDKYTKDPNIEDTLVAGSIGGIMNEASRVIPLLTDWITIHFRRINMDRLYKILLSLDEKEFESILVYWTANAQRLIKAGDQRSATKKIASLYQGKRRNYLELSMKNFERGATWFNSLIVKNGEDKRFMGTCMRVPNLVIRNRPKDVMKEKRLAQFHLPYRYRIMFGATYRADMWAALRKNPTASVSEIARFSYGSQPMAREVKMDYSIVKRDYSKRDAA